MRWGRNKVDEQSREPMSQRAKPSWRGAWDSKCEPAREAMFRIQRVRLRTQHPNW